MYIKMIKKAMTLQKTSMVPKESVFLYICPFRLDSGFMVLEAFGAWRQVIISRLTNQLREQSAAIATRAATHQQVRGLAEGRVRENDGTIEHRYELAKLGSSHKLHCL